MPVTKERNLPFIRDFPPVRFKESGAIAVPGGPATLATGKQKTVSEGHPFDRNLGHFVGGGPFFTSRVDYDFETVDVSDAWSTSGSDKLYSGPVYAMFPTPAELTSCGFTGQFGDSNESLMTSDGATAIHLCSPGNPAANLGTTLAESTREGLPSIPGVQSWKRRAGILKDAGDEYLNQVFGWLPLHREVTDVSLAARNQRDLLKQYHRDEGRNIHRRFEFPLRSTTTTGTPAADASARFPGWTSGFVSTVGSSAVRTVVRTTTTKRWFEGVFTYGVPSSTDSWRRSSSFGDKADHLLGLRLTPELLWELTPWSWAVDWFSNTGDIISNVNMFVSAGLVMRYGYMMEETIDNVTATLSKARLKTFLDEASKPNNVKGPLSSSVTIVTKRRVAANPFGFGIGWEGLSPTQLAITAALGITRLL